MVPPELPHQVLYQQEVPHQLGVLQVQGAVDQSSLPPLQLALWIKVCHSAGTPTHCSRTLSSWMWDHMPSGHTLQHHLQPTTKILHPPAGLYLRCMRWPHTWIIKSACLWPGPRLICWPHTSLIPPMSLSHPWLSTRGGLTGPWRADSPTISTSRPRGPTSANTKTKIESTSIYINICYTIKITKHKYTNIPLWSQPLQEATPCLGHAGSPSHHMGTVV
jgi:hypothetical protein